MKERALQARMPQADAPRPYDNVDVPATRVADAKQGLQWSAIQIMIIHGYHR